MFTSVALGLFGLLLGSFINALVWRVYMQSQGAKGSKKVQKADYSIINGRSMCPNCRHILTYKDLVPILSWVSLKGKCRYCNKPISWQYPLVELVTSFLFIISYLYWPLDWNARGMVLFAIWLVILTGYVALAVYDLKWMLLPNRIVYPLLFIATLGAILSILTSSEGLEVLAGMLMSVGISGGIFYLIFQISNGRWIGGGDVKLGALIGLTLVTSEQAFLVLFLASLLGTLIVLPGLMFKKINTRSRIPFGPFLIAAAIIVKIFGLAIVNWYEKSLSITA